MDFILQTLEVICYMIIGGIIGWIVVWQDNKKKSLITIEKKYLLELIDFKLKNHGSMSVEEFHLIRMI